jgi:L-threonylcarbamoyladenylate synthase
MKTHTLLADDPQAISDAQRLLRQGQVIAFPTDTVYGVGTHAFLPDAVAALYAAKNRPLSKAIPVLIARTDDVSRVARAVPTVTWQLAEEFWPGGLTIVLPRAEELPAIVTGGGDTVAIRCPHHPIPLTLMNAIDAPLAATSANLSGQPTPTTARQVAAQMAGRLPLIIDGGDSPGGIPSTVVDLSTCPPRLLRTGAVAAHQLRRLLPDLIEVE